MSVGFQSRSRSSAVNPQVTKAINLVVGCDYYSASQACGYLPSHRASPPIDWYQIILLAIVMFAKYIYLSIGGYDIAFAGLCVCRVTHKVVNKFG